MSRLSFYLTRQYLTQAMSLFAAVIFLVMINQALKLFDLITSKGQSIFTLFGQALLTTPPLSRAMFYICIGIGIARTLGSLQVSHELHTIHATRRIGGLWNSIFVTATIAALAVGLLAHWLEPLAYRSYADWTEQVAADLVGRTLEPNKFREVSPGLIVQIGGRLRDGTVTDFFADDTRQPGARRTYEARQAIISSDDEGLYLSLSDGRLQNQTEDGNLTEVAFADYKLGLEGLTQDSVSRSRIDEKTTWDFFQIAQTRPLDKYEFANVQGRFMEIPRVYVMCLLVAVLAGYPRGQRRGPVIPLEIFIVTIALADRIITDSSKILGVHGLSGVAFLFAISVGVMIWRGIERRLPRFGKAVS